MKTASIRIQNPTIRKLTHIMLSDLGFEITDENPSVIVLGWSDEQPDTLNIISQMRQVAPVLICSNYHHPEKIRQALDMGANEYVMIPFDNDILQSKLIQMGLL